MKANKILREHKTETAHLLIKCDSGSEKDIIEKIRALPEITHVCLTVGNYDILVKMEADSNDELRRAIIWKISKINDINSITTLFCTRRPLCVIAE